MIDIVYEISSEAVKEDIEGHCQSLVHSIRSNSLRKLWGGGGSDLEKNRKLNIPRI